MRAPFGPFWPFFYWLHGLSRLLIGGLPRTETDHPTINHRWSVRRVRILHFLQHCCLAGCVGSVRQFVVVTDAAVKKTPGYWIWWNVTWVKATCSCITWFESTSWPKMLSPAAGSVNANIVLSGAVSCQAVCSMNVALLKKNLCVKSYSDHLLFHWHCGRKTYFWPDFYPRLVLSFRYCRCLRLAVCVHVCIYMCPCVNPGPRFTKVFSIAIQIRWKFRFALTSILIQWLLQNFVHNSCAVVACAKICCDLMANNRITARQTFH